MIEEIPLFTDPAYRYTIAIEGVNYVFKFNYLQRQDALYLGVFNVDGTPIRTGIRLVKNWPLNARDADTLPGVLVAISQNNRDITLEDILNETFKILLISGADLIIEDDSDDPIVSMKPA